MLLHRLLGTGCALLWSALAHAGPAATLDVRWQALTAFEASFSQVQRDHDGTQLSASSGTMALARPGKFRWAYTEPYAQLIVSDGDNVWVHDPDLKQATRRPADTALADTPAELLASGESVGTRFEVLALPGDLDAPRGLMGWRLTPRVKDSDFERIDIWMQGVAPVRLVFNDALGGTTEVTFDDATTNPRFGRGRFAFDPPRGHEVIDLQ